MLSDPPRTSGGGQNAARYATPAAPFIGGRPQSGSVETTDRAPVRAAVALPLDGPLSSPAMSAEEQPPVPAGAPAATRVVIADDHAVVRTGLKMVLDAEEGIEVVAEAGDVEAALRAVRAYHPNVLVLDLNMPGEPSLQAIPRFVEQAPETAIVVLTMQQDPAFAREALRSGARGYVLKEAADAELVQAVRMATEGRTYLNPELGARMAAEPPPSGPPDDLTERELEVLRLIALGHTNSEIASQLYLSVRTVESHRAHIQQKVRRSSRAELVRYALDHGLIEAGGEA
jgi:two-component system, NarL family, response regulator NreC